MCVTKQLTTNSTSMSVNRNSLFRSDSFNDSGRTSPMPGARSGEIARRNTAMTHGHVSASLDDLFLNISSDKFQEWYPSTGGYSRTQGTRCLVIPDGVLMTEIVQQQRMFTLGNDYKRSNHNIQSSPNNVKKSPLTRSASIKTPNSHVGHTTNGFENMSNEHNGSPKTMSRSRTISSFNHADKKSESEVQIKRCISLYERQRKPHSCKHGEHTEGTVKPSPWTYGNNVSRREFRTSLDSPSKSSHTKRNGDMGCRSLDSSNSNGRPTFLSLTSSSSSTELDFDASPHKLHIVQSQNKDRHGNEHEISTSPVQRRSSIPRPITPMKDSRSRYECFTVNGTGANRTSEISGRRKPGTSADRTPGTSASRTPSDTSQTVQTTKSQGNMKRSQSCKDRPKSAIVRSTSSLAVQTPTRGGLTNGCSPQKSCDLSVSMETLEGARSTNGKELLLVPDDEAAYPSPQPPEKTRAAIYNPMEYTNIDQHVLKAEDSLLDTFEELLQFLLGDATTVLSKVRALYRWQIHQQLPLTTRPGYRNLNTPRGFLFNIRLKRASFAELFATLCRKADIQCVIIHGLAKGINYDPGDKVTVKNSKNSWNAVYLENDWHFVHPQWAARSVGGYRTGRWALVECDGFHTGEEVTPEFPMTSRSNDFYFLTDPDKFITKCFPDEPCWQLLHQPLSKSEFEELPFLQPSFYDLKLSVHGTSACVLQTHNGTAEVKIAAPTDIVKRYRFGYKLHVRRDRECEGEYDVMLLERYILHYIREDIAVFEIRFPITGVFKLEIYCKDPKRTLASDLVCDYKIVCSEIMPECEPLPVVPVIGWGPGECLEVLGMECLTHKNAVVNLDGDTVTYIRFALPKNKTIRIEADLVTNNQSAEALRSHVSTGLVDEQAVVKVSPPGEGEYALQLFMEDDNGDRVNVCNFLMHRTTIVEDPELADIRAELIKCTESGDVDSLSHWLNKFADRNMEDRGDMARAKKKLLLVKLQRDIREAMGRKDLDLLEKALHSVSDASIRRYLGELVVQAEAMRSRLRRLKRLCHDVLAMDQKTISEIRSYPKPPVAVHGVMAATFLLLGNKESELKKWSNVQCLISKRGKESVKRRVAEFSTENVRPTVLSRVHTILSRYDLETVKIASAGAATFYQWAITMAGEAGPGDSP